ncbi:MAG: heavy metal translocating P-type ATPase [Gemmatimonadetes bacterium]|nr:heavy metal translocating P-type ATPase [Gemmatimonadota bacterium]MDA1104699.1 heavy metal translocating P-type ATPase [Gemmatimonadota bacterium]
MGSNCCDIKGQEPDRIRLQAASTAIALVAVMAGWLLPLVGLTTVAFAALLVAYAAGGWHTARQAFRALRCGDFDVDLLMLLAAVGAAVVGHWLEGAVLLFLFSLGNTLETYAFGKTRRSIEALVQLRPEEAARIVDGVEEAVRLELLAPGDVVRVRPGERIPVDGTVVAGESRVDESTLTGESIPVAKAADAAVFAGTLNVGGSLEILMTRASDDTALARIIRLVEEAQDSKAPTQSWIEKVESRYALGVILAAVGAILIPWLVLGWTFDEAFYRAMTLLVVASPCALVISIPATIVSAVSNGARHGVLFKGGAYLDSLASVTTFALDKTGTVTVGRPEVIGVRAATGVAAATATSTDTDAAWSDSDEPMAGEDWMIRLAAGAESHSEHHLAAAILRAASDRGLSIPDPSAFVSTAGQGVEATVEGHRVEVGRRSWIESRTGATTDPFLMELFQEGRETATPIHLAIDGRHVGAFAVQDHPRPGTREALEALTRAGVKHLVMLTGDAEATAKSVAAEVGITEVHWGLLPDDKVKLLAELRTRGPVAMVGDGVNDAPALATADVGIAIGVAGTDVALETADVVVMGDDLSSLALAVRLSQRTRRIVKQNLAFSLAVMAGLVVAALMGWIGLTAGVIGHEGSTIVVVFNGLRLLADGR